MIYSVLSVTVAVRHWLENRRLWAPSTLAWNTKTAVLFLSLAIPLAGSVRLPDGVEALLWTPSNAGGNALRHSPLLLVAAMGISNQKNQAIYGLYDPSRSFENVRGIGIEHLFVQWQVIRQTELQSVVRRYNDNPTRLLLVTVEPFTRAANWRDGSEKLFDDILAGGYDAEISTVCGSLSAARRPVLLRWGHEMDSAPGRYPWVHAEPIGYVSAYRYFVQRCRAIAPKAKFVWSPTGLSDVQKFYPGDEYVDFVGISAYSFFRTSGSGQSRQGIHSFGKKLYQQGMRMSRVFGKPMIVAELGVSGSDEYVRTWFGSLNRSLEYFPLIQAVVLFNAEEPSSWGPLVWFA